jgi:hypothetical protein
MALSPGVRLGPYEIVAPLGSGGMGEVYRATDPRLRREVAIKILPAGLANDPERLHRFEQEALAAASLNHPNILAVYDIGVHPSTGSEEAMPYIVSELLEGGTLRQTLESGSVPLRKALDYAVQIANGLAAAHEKGIVHRDLKPENLFVTRDGRVKILDFGLAKLTQPESAPLAVSNLRTGVQQTEAGVIVGTIGYMSPEQVRGVPADPRSDIFSFALVLHEMLSGRRAFAAPSAVETMHAILTQDPPDLVRPDGPVPPALDRIIRRCLEKNPEQRFQSARDLAFNLGTLSSDSDARMAPAATTAAPRRRSRALPAVVVGLLVVAAAGAGFLASNRFGGPRSPTFTRLTFRRGTVQAARFAPDGQTIVYSAAWQGRAPEVFSTRVGSTEARSLELTGARLLSLSPAGDMALRLSNGTLARAPLAGGSPREIVERVLDAAWAPDGRTLAIVRTTGGRRRLEFPPGTVLYETAGQISDIAVAPDGASIVFAESPPGIGPVISIGLVDLRGTRRTLSTGWRSIHGMVWPWSGGEILFAASRSLYGAGTVYGITLAGRSREIAKVPGDLNLYDALPDGRMLLGRADVRLEARGLTAGDSRERDLSWFDFTGLSDLTPDGRTILMTEDGEAGLHVYVRKTDGSPAVQLGEGGGFGLSPDQRSLIVARLRQGLGILPVGAGDIRFIPHPGFDGYQWANWFPDGKRILVAGSESGHGLRLYVESVDGSDRHPIAPEGIIIPTGARAISPDGMLVAALQNGRIVLCPVEGGELRALPGLAPGDFPSGWSADGRSLYVFRRDELPTRVFRVDVATGRKDLWKEVGPSDAAGVTGIGHLLITPDGVSYVYNYVRSLSDLYLVEGLR